MAGISQKVVYTLRKEINRKLSLLPLHFFDKAKHGDVLSRAVNDLEKVSSTLRQSLTQIITSTITMIGVTIMMLLISPLLTIIVLLTLPLSILVTKKVVSMSQKFFKGRQQSLGVLNTHVEEMYTGHETMKAFGREQQSIGHFQAVNSQLYHSGWKAQFISSIIMPILRFINNIIYVLICVLGSILVMLRSMTIGEVQAFILYIRLFSQPITRVANVSNIIQSTVAAAERVFEILDEPEEEASDDKQVLPNPKGHVRFEHVTFGYQQDKPVMEDVHFDVKPGQTAAIVGPTGAGKTTIINLLMRFYEADSGRITIDGIPIRDLNRDHLRSMFGLVLQDTWLFHGTIKENIAYGREDATEEEIIQAAEAAYADRFIRTLSHGYDSLLNESTSNISQGQKQLLTIARAVISDPAILILDEATSNVDARTEIHIQRALNRLMKGRTSFIIAHRLSTIQQADTILVMDQGQVIEQGSHEALLAKGGFYAELYHNQFAVKANDKQKSPVS